MWSLRLQKVSISKDSHFTNQLWEVGTTLQFTYSTITLQMDILIHIMIRLISSRGMTSPWKLNDFNKLRTRGSYHSKEPVEAELIDIQRM